MNQILQMIPYDDFGGRGPVLHFSHPNAYTPRCFRRFLACLTERHHVIAGRHRPLWYLSPDAPSVPGPETFNDWNLIADCCASSTSSDWRALSASATLWARWRR